MDILPLQAANGIKKGDLSTVICLEDIIENLPHTDKVEFANNNVETLLTNVDELSFGQAAEKYGYVNKSDIGLNDLIDSWEYGTILDKIPTTDILEYVGTEFDDDDLIEMLEGRGYVVNEQ